MQPVLEVDAGLMGRWLRDLTAHKVGKNTLVAAMGCLSHLSELLGFEYNGDSKLLRNLSYRYAEGHSHEIDQAKEYSIKWLSWAEAMSLGLLPATKPDRLVCGRMRMLAQTSTRHHDQKHTPDKLVNWVLNKDQSKRAVAGQCTETKIFAGTWVCSRLAFTPEHDGWLEAAIELALEAHSIRREIDDRFGKKALQDRSNLDSGPPSGQAYTNPIRFLMIKARDSDGGGVFSDSEVSAFRHHGAKCTIPTLAQSLGLNRKAVRDQGGWRGVAEDLMPDRYMRQKQVLALDLQEKCLSYLRGGGEMPEVVTAPLVQETPSLLEHSNTLVEEAKTQVAPQVIATSSESESEADSEACSSVISEAEKFSGAVIVGNVKSGKYHRADEDHPELVLPACHAGKLHYECIDAENFTT